LRDFGAILRSRSLDLSIAGSLLLVVLGIYAPVRHYDFVIYDDHAYVTTNRQVLSGLNANSVRWAFTSTENANWFPLTWISLMADRQLFASPEEVSPHTIRAGPYHWTNVILHATATLLLFGLLKRMTGASGPSALVAFLFAAHPLHVESVAWVSERKDVLSAVFWMLALWSYARYASRPKPGTYLLTLLFYCLGFMAKPMVVTLPVVLLLLDIWPLRRLPIPAAGADGILWRQVRKLVWEKLPFFALALAMAVTTFVVQKQGGAMRTLGNLPLAERLGNATISAAIYAGKTLWPTRMAVFYPFPATLPVWQSIVAGLVLVSLTALAIASIRKRPYLTVGWLWYAITVLPVIGIVQVGLQSRADRYTYIPSIGLFVMLAWSGADAWNRWPKVRTALAVACGAACLACVALTWRQIPYWRNSVTLFQHTIAVTGPNAIGHGILGQSWEGEVMFDEAIAEYRRGLEVEPHNVGLLVDLGALLGRQGRVAEAVAPLAEAVRLGPDDPLVRNALGAALAALGRTQEALPHLQEAIRLKPDLEAAHATLGTALANLGRFDEAIAQLSEAVRLNPKDAEARVNLEKALERKTQEQRK
jgi:hypothetical protein